MLECTLAGNSDFSGNGGAIDNDQGPLQLLQCTIAGNSASEPAAGRNYLNTLAMTNCIIAGNGGEDIFNFTSSTINAGGTNIVVSITEQAGSTFNGGGSIISPAPMLAPLGNYGGPTPTMPPLSGSPAIDGGSAAALAGEGFSVDQRGYPRVFGARVDIGAGGSAVARGQSFGAGEHRLSAGGGGGARAIQFTFNNTPDADFTVLTSTNVALPLTDWTVLGEVMQVSPGQYKFTDPQAATNYPRRFYKVRSP